MDNDTSIVPTWTTLNETSDNLTVLDSVADPHNVDAASDPDPAGHFDADPDSTFTVMRIRTRILPVLWCGSELPNKNSKRWKGV